VSERAEPEESAEVERLFALVKERYERRLTPEQLDDLRNNVAAVAATVRPLRAIRLKNADEPFQPFAPYRADR
jgi:hypothetical protein